MNLFDLFGKADKSSSEAKDPICGMKIDLGKTPYKTVYEEKVYGFCSANCKETFDKQMTEKKQSPPGKHSCC